MAARIRRITRSAGPAGVGSLLLGDVSGFVVAGMITGYQIVNRSVRFDLSAPSPEILARYTRHRITARRGALLQVL